MRGLRGRSGVGPGILMFSLIAAGLFVLGGLTGCTSAPSVGARGVDYAPAVSELRELVRSEMDRLGIPCAGIALVDGNQIIWEESFGWQDAEAGVPATEETVYRVGSISKLFTATAIMQLQERGILDIRAPVQRYAPEAVFENTFNPGTAITLRHLMTHTAGIQRESSVGGYFDSSSPGIERTARSFFGTELVYPVGRRTSYSNLGPTIAGYILKKTTGVPFEEYVRKNVLEPAGMTSSSFLRDIAAVRHKLATAYMVGFDGRPFPAPLFDLGTIPAGNLYSTVGDMARFMICLFRDGEGPNGRLLSKGTLRSMLQVQFPSSIFSPYGFGLGWYVSRFEGRKKVGHDGAVYGFSSDFWALPAEKLGVVVLNNLDCASGFNTKITHAALGLLLNAKLGATISPLPEPVNLDAASLEEYPGQYEAKEGTAWVALEQAGLGLRFLGSPYLLRPLGGDRFLSDGRNDYGTMFEFLRDSTGHVTALKKSDWRVVFPKVADDQPSGDVREDQRRYCGDYGWPWNVMRVYGKDGKLTCLVEWFFEYPLSPESTSTFALPGYGLYAGEKLQFIEDAEGRVIEARLGPVSFPRL